LRALAKKPEDANVIMDGSTILEATPDETFEHALDFAVRTIETVVRRWGDPDILPFLHTILVFMNHMTRYPAAMSHLEKVFPWESTSLMLNSLLDSGKPGYKVQSRFRQPEKDQLPRQVLEGFAMRGLLYSKTTSPTTGSGTTNTIQVYYAR
jgi:hypothetical protein